MKERVREAGEGVAKGGNTSFRGTIREKRGECRNLHRTRRKGELNRLRKQTLIQRVMGMELRKNQETKKERKEAGATNRGG